MLAAEFTFHGWGFTLFLDPTRPASVLWTGSERTRAAGLYRLNAIKGQIDGVDNYLLKVRVARSLVFVAVTIRTAAPRPPPLDDREYCAV